MKIDIYIANTAIMNKHNLISNSINIYLVTSILLVFIFLTGCTYGSRPQMPTERHYVIKEVLFPSKNISVQLAGELTMPQGEGSYPAVILITGSGKQDRDETYLGHKHFLVISDYLTRMGFAVLRYDDRGVGKSTGDYANADLFDFADDAVGAYNWLKKQSHIDKEKIGYLGHSEGGYIAPIAALESPANFMVFLAGPAKPAIPDVMITQSEDLARSEGKPAKVINNYKYHYQKLARILKQSKNAKEAEQSIMQWLKAEGSISYQTKETIKLFANRWGMAYAKYDPVLTLDAFKRPVLALYGGSDLQVSAQQNAPVMKKVLSHPQSQVCVLANKNHLFQNSKTGKTNEYYKITTTIEPDVLEKISRWLKIVTRVNQNSRFTCE